MFAVTAFEIFSRLADLDVNRRTVEEMTRLNTTPALVVAPHYILRPTNPLRHSTISIWLLFVVTVGGSPSSETQNTLD